MRLAIVMMVGVLASAAAVGCGDSSSSTSDATPAGGVSTATQVSSQTTAPGSTQDDPCRLVTAEEAAALLGGPVEPEANSTGPVTSCTYARDPATDGILSVTVTSDLSYFEAQKANLPTATPVADLGDDAVWDATLGQLLVQADGQAVGLTWGGNGITADEASAVALARAILARL
jgi:hypothetical protein